MYTKKTLSQFADWMEKNLEIDDDEKRNIALGITSGLTRNKIDFSNLSTNTLIQLFRMKIRLVKYCNLGLCKKEDEKILFAGLEKWRRKYEFAMKSAREDKKEKRVSGWW